MSEASISFRQGVLAWAVSPADEARFQRIVRTALALGLGFALLLAWLPRPQVDRQRAQLPPPLARLLLERDTPRPAAPPPAPRVTPSVALAPPPSAKDAARPERPAQPLRPPAARTAPDRPGTESDAARRRATGVGLLAMTHQLAEIHGAPAAPQLQARLVPGPGVGSGSGVGVGAGTEPGLPARALIVAAAARGSGGIDTAGYSRHTGGAGLAGRATTLVGGVAGGGTGHAGASTGPGSGSGSGGTRGDGAASGRHAGGSGAATARASRSIEDIKLVFDRHKGAIHALYNRALREDPGLQGKVVLELRIAPSGAVADCRIVASELRADDLERKLVARVRQFDFGAKDVETMVVSWPVDFLPS